MNKCMKSFLSVGAVLPKGKTKMLAKACKAGLAAIRQMCGC